MCNIYLRALCPKLSIPREPPGSNIATCILSPPASRHTLPTSQHASYRRCHGRTADINEKAGVSLLVSETDVRSIGFDLPCSGNGRIPHHHDAVRLRTPISCRLMPVPPALHWNLKMPQMFQCMDDGGDLIASISVFRRCQHYSLPQCGRLSPGLHCTRGK